jgi:hypothetical protein
MRPMNSLANWVTRLLFTAAYFAIRVLRKTVTAAQRVWRKGLR